ncbi:PepSY domain-containing protein [Curtobacterium sp. MCPF17_002]|uniref:PepSY domain-containing protein n=1 Tax=Curtobacterium sp. MCPF17_002 TaxID=2175645 RepID=UPI000DAAD0C0|nr:PepSY domain-containing protein [Curtobacterium sp. MCPF17_002]WIB76304.1 PepSY domain-containing protein [Curtobacterium sp. MCPF17_002]
MNTNRNDSIRTTSRTARRIAGFAALPLVASLALVGCSSAESGSGSNGGSDTGSSAGSASGSASGSATAASNDALLAAIETARKAVDASTVISVEQEQNGSAYEVLVVTSDGNEHEVHATADGTSVDGSPRTEQSDADDRAENERFVGAADLDVQDAVSKFEDLHAGTITELGLDDHLGKVVWEGDVRDSSGTKHSVRIDAGSGAVVTDAVDTDD